MNSSDGFNTAPTGKFPSDWKILTLGKISSDKLGNVNPLDYPEELFDHFSIPAYQETGAPALELGSTILSQKQLVGKGTVLFGKLNPRVEKVWYVASDSKRRQIASTEWLPVLPNSPDYNSHYLYFLMWSSHVMAKAQTMVSGSTPSRQRVDPTSFYKIAVPVPPLAEQKKIATVLSNVWKSVDAQVPIIGNLRELKKATMNRLFTHGLRGEPLKQTDLGPVPKSWKVVKCGEYVTLQRGQDLPRADFAEGKIPVIGATQIIGYHSTANVKGPGVTVVRSGSSAGFAQFVGCDFWAHNVVLYAKDFHGHDAKFVSYHLNHLDLSRFKGGVAVPTLNRNVFSSLTTGVPDLKEQLEIAHCLETIDETIALHEAKKSALEDLFKAMLNKLMKGEIRVKDLDINTSEVA